MSRNQYTLSKTICWKCRNAVPRPDGTAGCSWSRSFTPVQGWKADQYPCGTKKTGEVIYSYVVNQCPEFEDDTEDYAQYENGSVFKYV